VFAYFLAIVPAKRSSTRLRSEDRRLAIIEAALQVFSANGFHGATTKALAKAAGVSEALLFRHFPSKEDLYAAIQTECCRLKSNEEATRLMQLDPSTSTLVITVHFLIAKMLILPKDTAAIENSLHRMLAQSFMGDGQFARQFMHHLADELIAKLTACIKAADKAGDLVDSPVRPDLRAWFVEHFAAMLMLNQMPGEPIVVFKASPAAQLEQATWFALLGLGVKPEAIRRHYNPKGFALLGS
jgi:AcrR family transcriptional regulator